VHPYTRDLVERLEVATNNFSQQGTITVPPEEAMEFYLAQQVFAVAVLTGCPTFLRREAGIIRLTAFPNSY